MVELWSLLTDSSANVCVYACVCTRTHTHFWCSTVCFELDDCSGSLVYLQKKKLKVMFSTTLCIWLSVAIQIKVKSCSFVWSKYKSGALSQMTHWAFQMANLWTSLTQALLGPSNLMSICQDSPGDFYPHVVFLSFWLPSTGSPGTPPWFQNSHI